MTVHNWKNGKNIPRYEALLKAKENGIDVIDYVNLALNHHSDMVKKLKDLKKTK